MSVASRIINRGEFFYEGDVRNKWKWEWTEKTVAVDGEDQRVAAFFRKVTQSGVARCVLSLHVQVYVKLL
jgi:hypothetical protein